MIYTNLQHLAIWRNALPDDLKVVATNGCFDLLHIGHVRLLHHLCVLTDPPLVTVVGLNSDYSVRQFKGFGRPIQPQADRAEILDSLDGVDVVAIFDDARATEFLAACRPTHYMKGGDYTLETLHPPERDILERYGAEISFFPTVLGKSTSKLIAGQKC